MTALCLGRKDLPVHISFSNRKTAEIINVSREYAAILLQNLSKKCRISIQGSEIFFYPCDIERLLDQPARR